MKKIWLLLPAFLMLVWVPPALGQSSQDDLAYSNQDFEQWAKKLAEFVKDVHFNESDIQSFINLADDFAAIGAKEDGADEEYVDFNTIAKNAEYLAWARSKGINSETWLKKTMRIIAAMMQTEIEANRDVEQVDMQEQIKQLEAMRDQMGEEVYQQALKSMSAASAAMQGLDNAYKYLPVPTEAEKALMAKYSEELMNLGND
jgi:hypothetical protein